MGEVRGVVGEERVGALSLTGTTVTVMVVFWGGWLVGGGSGEGGVGEKELGGGGGNELQSESSNLQTSMHQTGYVLHLSPNKTLPDLLYH